MKSLSSCLILGALALAACERAAAPSAPAPKSAEAPEPVPVEVVEKPAIVPAVNIDDVQTRAAAFRAAWGSAPPVTFRPKGTDAFEDQTYNKAKLVPVAPDLYALITEGQGGEGHVSAGSLAIHYLKPTAEGFERVGAWPGFLITGTFGNPPQWTIRQDLTTSPALVAEAGGTWQGYSCSWAHVIELTPERPVTRIDQVSTGYSDGGARVDGEKVTDVSGQILAGEKGRTIRVRYTGDRKAVVTYAKVGATYDPVDPPDLPGC